ncbi:nitroreductase family protein [Mycoplasmopsis cricetuli]|uniref:hypothetical protein n=1 Tax=Mycoplasmopsis cricetuli TaxID=171283 RepID=UPI0004713131|nr:hypothetical protein [Mycoplasmopsis cricetuli]
MFLDIIKKRRSNFDLNNDISISEQKLIEDLKTILKESPTSFHGQSTKIIVLLNDKSIHFWNQVKNLIPDKINNKKFSGFLKAKGTILFFIDKNILQNISQKTSIVYEQIYQFAIQDSAFLQANIWNYFIEKNIGANLQHYNFPEIDQMIISKYKISSNWSYIAQMPFGGIEIPAKSIEKNDVNTRIKVIK